MYISTRLNDRQTCKMKKKKHIDFLLRGILLWTFTLVYMNINAHSLLALIALHLSCAI